MTLKGSIILLIAGAAIYYSIHRVGWLDGTPFSLHPEVTIDFAAMPSNLKEGDLYGMFPELEWDCYDEKTSMGVRSCSASIRAWNKICSKYIAFFFSKEDRLRMVKVSVPPRCYVELKPAFKKQYGEYRNIPKKPGQEFQVLSWRAGRGLLTTTEQPETDGDNTVLWISGRSVLEDVLGN